MYSNQVFKKHACKEYICIGICKNANVCTCINLRILHKTSQNSFLTFKNDIYNIYKYEYKNKKTPSETMKVQFCYLLYACEM